MDHYRPTAGRLLLGHRDYLDCGTLRKPSERGFAVVLCDPTLLFADKLVFYSGGFLQHLCADRGDSHLATRGSAFDFPCQVLFGGGGLRFSDVVFHSLESDRAHPSVLIDSSEGHGVPCPYEGG